MSETATPPSADGNPKVESKPGLVDGLSQVNQASQRSLDSATQALHALICLLSADLALARGALRQALVWSAVVVVCATSAWLLFILALTICMQRLGVPWPAALLLSGLISLIAAFTALGKVRFYLRHTDLAATRRQLAKLHWPQTRITPVDKANQEPTA